MSFLRSAWIDGIFLILVVGILFAGMRGFDGFFTLAMGAVVVYLAISMLRIGLKRKSPRQ